MWLVTQTAYAQQRMSRVVPTIADTLGICMHAGFMSSLEAQQLPVWVQLCGVWRGCTNIALYLVCGLRHDSANPVLLQAPCADV